MDNAYLDALMMAALAFASLLFISCFVMATVTIMNRVMLYREKRGGFRLHSHTKQIKKDDKRNVVIAAAVAAYLRAEEESRR